MGPDDPHPDEWFPLEELAERVAGLVWVERQLGRLLVGWAAIEEHPGARILMLQAGRHHDWHAEVLSGCLPTSVQLEEVARPSPPTEGWRDAVERLAEVDDPAQTISRLGAVVRELDPWLARESDTLFELARPIADAPLLRWLRFIEIDHDDDGRGMAELLDALAANTVSLTDHSMLHEIDLQIRGSVSPHDGD